MLVAFLISEIALRILGISYPVFYTWDDDLGMAPIPGAEGIYSEEGYAFVRMNAAGLRDRDHTFVKPAGTLRIAILGDSYAEAIQVPLEQTFWSIAGERLQSCARPGRSVEVLNFGVSGYGTAQELIMLRERVWRYSPDFVLLLFTSNDIRDNSRALRSDPQRPYFGLDGNSLVLDDSFRTENPLHFSPWIRLYYQLLERSRLVQVFHLYRSRVLGGPVTLPERADPTVTTVPEAMPFNPLPRQRPQTPAETDAWAMTGTLLETMAQEVRDHGASFVVVTDTTGEQVAPDRARRLALESAGVDLLYVERWVEAIGHRDGFPTVLLAAPMRRYAEESGAYLHGFASPGTGHWNVAGHRVAGELVADALCDSVRARG